MTFLTILQSISAPAYLDLNALNEEADNWLLQVANLKQLTASLEAFYRDVLVDLDFTQVSIFIAGVDLTKIGREQVRYVLGLTS